MQDFINKYRDQINGVLSGFDRLVFRGSLRGLNYGYFDRRLESIVAKGMEAYLCQNKMLFKDYSDFVKRVSREVKQASILAFERLGLPVPFLRNPSADKEVIVRQIAQDKRVESGWYVLSARWSQA